MALVAACAAIEEDVLSQELAFREISEVIRQTGIVTALVGADARQELDEGIHDAIEVHLGVPEGILEQLWVIGCVGQFVHQRTQIHAHLVGVSDGLQHLVLQPDHAHVPEEPALVLEVEQAGRVPCQWDSGDAC